MNTFRYVTLLLIFLAGGCEQAPDAAEAPDALQGPDATAYVFPDAQSSPSDTGLIAPDEGANTPDPTPSDDPTAPPTTEGGACVSGEPDDYPSCCDLADTRCVPKDQVEAGLHSLFASCEEGSVCISGLVCSLSTFS